MMSNEFESAKDELIREAASVGNQMCKLKQGDNAFIKAKHGYSYPEALRLRFLQAFDALVKEGRVKIVFTNAEMELGELTAGRDSVLSVEDARSDILAEIKRSGSVYKIHGRHGEYVQLGSRAISEIEGERITYLKSLGQLIHTGEIHPLSDNGSVARFTVGWASTQPSEVNLIELLPPAQAA